MVRRAQRRGGLSGARSLEGGERHTGDGDPDANGTCGESASATELALESTSPLPVMPLLETGPVLSIQH